ncbi:MAG: hypothetical protein NZ480_06680 [Bdellovibrionaceae bacterium]|nr:hypothetical protein [Pseudobdellovibrionaceae bacterium]MDW8189648.1 hypothetical protein [Pseudobdellovibrionaceae bacterium]
MYRVNLFVFGGFFLIGLVFSGEGNGFYERNWSFDHKLEVVSWQTLSLTHGNFDEQGSGYDRLPAQHQYYVFHVSPNLRYALGDWGLRLGGRYGYAVSENGFERRQNGQLDFLSFGLDYVQSFRKWRFIPFAGYVLPIFSNDLTKDIVAVGDGERMMRFGSELRWQGSVSWRVAGEYQVRNVLADLFRFQTDLGWRGWYVGFEGMVTAREQGGSQSSIVQWQCLANGCSQSAMAWNPQRYQFYLGYTGSSWGILVQHSLQGKNAAYETLLGIVVTFKERSAKQGAYGRKSEFLEEGSEYNNGESNAIPTIPIRSIDPNRSSSQKKNIPRPNRRKSPQHRLDDTEQYLEQRQLRESLPQEPLDESSNESDD